MQPEKIQELVNKYLNGTATPEEQQMLPNWYAESQNDPVLNGKTGQIASQAGKQILINAHGQIAYVGTGNSNEPVYNTLTVPIGNSRDLTLPDGSEVSLDAGSSITYPVVFKSERRVSMTGQAYFKVKHDTRHPFYTIVKGITIKDIGTEFNINAYDDEPVVKTTLIQGSVKVNETLLKPGQQAQIKDNSIEVKQADMDAVTAWKDNDFYFDNQSLKSSMRQIARWYNVKVVYNNVDEKLQLFVDVTRATNLSVVLKAIENTGKVKCNLEDNTITLSQPN
jgi:transmembrane sensor